MRFLLDTNVVSEWTKVRPNAGVMAWLADADEDQVFLSVITLAVLRHGIERLPTGNRRKRLDEWVRDDVAARFGDRLLMVDAEIANEWGRVVAARDAAGRPIGVMDAFIAATANTHALTLVTRNAADFHGTVGSVVNPWTHQ